LITDKHDANIYIACERPNLPNIYRDKNILYHRISSCYQGTGAVCFLFIFPSGNHSHPVCSLLLAVNGNFQPTEYQPVPLLQNFSSNWTQVM